jgi:hypothetical protein
MVTDEWVSVMYAASWRSACGLASREGQAPKDAKGLIRGGYVVECGAMLTAWHGLSRSETTACIARVAASLAEKRRIYCIKFGGAVHARPQKGGLGAFAHGGFDGG